MDGTSYFVGGANPDTFYFDVKNEGEQSVIVPGNVRSGNVRIGLQITEKKASVFYAADQLTREISKPVAGHLTLHGGELGFTFSALAISGRVNSDWAATFFVD